MGNAFLLEGKTAIVTGGSRGIGKAIALRFAEMGANTAIIYAGNVDAANQVKNFIEAEVQNGHFPSTVKTAVYRCNVGDAVETEQTVKKIIEDFGSIDILVNNAGITKDNLLLKMKEADFDDVININLKGAFHMIKNVYSHMAKRKSGRIINISSVSALLGTAGQANYVSSKAGLIGLTKTVARELGARGITCNAIAPGYIETDMTASLKEELKQDYRNQIPMKRFGSVTNIADTALFLASDMAAYITGEVIRVDGGLCM